MDEKDLKIQQLEFRLNELEFILKNHQHSGTDGSHLVDADIVLGRDRGLAIGEFAMGCGVIYEGSTAASTPQQNSKVENFGTEPMRANRNFSRKGIQTQLTDEPNSGTYNSFFYAFRAPFIISGTGTLTNGGSTLTDSTRSFSTNELAGAVLYVFSGTDIEAFTIASNTATVITVSGTWTVPTNPYSYVVARRVFLGAANAPWRRLYTNEIRMGEGGSAGSQVVWIKYGTGSPENAVTAPPGSIYLREDGGANTSLYVKESGVSNTGWIPK